MLHSSRLLNQRALSAMNELCHTILYGWFQCRAKSEVEQVIQLSSSTELQRSRFSVSFEQAMRFDELNPCTRDNSTFDTARVWFHQPNHNRCFTSCIMEVKAPQTSQMQHFDAEIKAEGNSAWTHARTA